MVNTESPNKPEESSSEQALNWRVWLPQRRPLLSVGVALLVVALTVTAAVIFDSPFYAMLTIVVLTAAVSSHYVPLDFRLDSDGVTVASFWGRRTKPWGKLKTYWPNGEDGVAVSPSVHRGLLAAARDFYLHFAGNREEVLRYLARCLSPVKKSGKA